MPKEAVFTIKLEPELRDEFMAAAQAADRPASQVVRELMREFVQRQRDELAYNEFLRRKVDVARASIRAGRGRPNEEVEAETLASITPDQSSTARTRSSPEPESFGPAVPTARPNAP